MNICVRFNHIKYKGACELGQGRIAPADCKSCSSYLADPQYKNRSNELDRLRDDTWSAMLFRRERVGT